MPRRILIVSNFFPPHIVGGAELVAYRQARALAERGHEVAVLGGMAPGPGAPSGSLDFDIHEGLPVYRLPLRSLDPALSFHWPAAAQRLRSLLSSLGTEIVHFHNVMGMGANLIPAARAFGARTLVTLHDHWGFCYRNTRLNGNQTVCGDFDDCHRCLATIRPGAVTLPIRLRRDYVLHCLACADHLLTPSAYLKTAYVAAGVPAESLDVVSNGIDLDAVPCPVRASAAGGVTRFLCSAYLGEHKGMLVLLEAAALLVRDLRLNSRWKLTIAGEGHLRYQMEGFISDHGLGAHVTLAGRVPRAELLKMMGASDVALLASIWPENEPVSMLEAVASGMAQIATRLGGNLELVEDGETGFLVAPGDAADLAEKMLRYIEDPALISRHGQRNRERRADFDERTAIDHVEALYAAPAMAMPGGGGPGIILCAGQEPAAAVFEVAAHLHRQSSGAARPRLLWHEWAEGRDWDNARALWLWDHSPNHVAAMSAARHGVPIVAPVGSWVHGLAGHYGGVVGYQTYLEAMAALRGMLAFPRLRDELATRVRACSAAGAALAPRSAFELSAETK